MIRTRPTLLPLSRTPTRQPLEKPPFKSQLDTPDSHRLRVGSSAVRESDLVCRLYSRVCPIDTATSHRVLVFDVRDLEVPHRVRLHLEIRVRDFPTRVVLLCEGDNNRVRTVRRKHCRVLDPRVGRQQRREFAEEHSMWCPVVLSVHRQATPSSMRLSCRERRGSRVSL